MVDSQRNTIDHGGLVLFATAPRPPCRVLRRQPVEHDLELAPRYWRITRTRLDREELDREVANLERLARALRLAAR